MTASFDSNVNITVSIAFGNDPFDASPTWTDVSAYVRGFATSRGRSSVLSVFGTGTATVDLDNRDGRFSPNNTAGAYYPNVKVFVPIRIQAVYNLTTYTLFRGSVERWPLEFPALGKDAVVRLFAVENMKLLALHDLTGEVYAEESTDTRIGNVLDDAGWPAGWRDLDTGVADCQATTVSSGTALDHLRAVARTEVGQFFIAADGDATFRNRVDVSGGITPSITFGQGGSELGYRDIVVSYDDDFLWNESRVTREGGTEQVASDATSQADYGTRSLSRSGELMVDDNAALNVAEWEVGKFKDVKTRVDQLSFQPRSDPSNLWTVALNTDLRTPVTVKLTPPAGDTLDVDCTVEQVAHSVSPKSWTTTWMLAPISALESTSFWVLGTSLLDTGSVLA